MDKLYLALIAAGILAAIGGVVVWQWRRRPKQHDNVQTRDGGPGHPIKPK